MYLHLLMIHSYDPLNAHHESTTESHQGELMQKYNLGGKVVFAETDKVHNN